jgi:hypothetical protein
LDFVRRTRVGIVHTGGRFMASPELSRQEREAGAAPRSLYFRGRTGVLGDLPTPVVADLVGIFPRDAVGFALDRAPQLPADVAVESFRAACRDWARGHLAPSLDPAAAAHCAELLFEVVDRADGGALALFSAWRATPRPTEPVDRFAHGLLLARELRGGLHFAAIRAVGLTIAEAVLLDPDSEPARLTQLGWRRTEVLAARERLTTDAESRRARAEELTDQAFAAACAVLTVKQLTRLAAAIDLIAVPSARAPSEARLSHG